MPYKPDGRLQFVLLLRILTPVRRITGITKCLSCRRRELLASANSQSVPVRSNHMPGNFQGPQGPGMWAGEAWFTSSAVRS